MNARPPFTFNFYAMPTNQTIAEKEEEILNECRKKFSRIDCGFIYGEEKEEWGDYVKLSTDDIEEFVKEKLHSYGQLCREEGRREQREEDLKKAQQEWAAPVELAPHNFRVKEINGVPPSKWTEEPSGLRVAPTGDVWLVCEGEEKGEQLFTWDAAMRETKRAGKCMPTDEEWDLFPNKTDIPNVVYTGYRYTNSSYGSRTYVTYLWSSTESAGSAYVRCLYYSLSEVFRVAYVKANGFSVRCLKD